MRLGLVAVLASVGAGCFVGRVWMVDYKFDTSAVRDASGRETVLSTSRVADEVDLTAEDDHAAFAFRFEPGRIRVSIRNRGTEALSLDLDEASYVDASGQTHRLFLFDRDLAQERGLEIQQRSTADLSLWPRDWTRSCPEGPCVFRGDSPLGGSTIEENSREKALAQRQQDMGKRFEIVLPLRIADERVSYRFRFTVSELVARRIWSA
jgi:hypothetical protein